MTRQKWTGWIVCIACLAVIVALSGCSLLKSGDDGAIDPPPTGANQGVDDPAAQQVNGMDDGSGNQNTMEVMLYFEDPDGFVVPLSLRIPATESVARRSLEYMVAGGPGEELLPEGFRALLPQGTVVSPIDIKQKLATVDFSDHFASYNVQDERKIMEAVTWTLTGFEAIDQVKLRINGYELDEMPIGGTPMDEPLTRAMGINLERVNGVEYGQSTPVTLYFQNQLSDQFTYYVPVTRMVARTENVIGTAIHELIKGPLEERGLLAVLNPDTELLLVDLDSENDAVTINFSEQLLANQYLDTDDAYESVVMSLWENIGKKQVRILVNGEAKAATGEQIPEVLTVNRPIDTSENKL